MLELPIMYVLRKAFKFISLKFNISEILYFDISWGLVFG